MDALAHISVDHPEEQIVVWIQAGNITIGFAKSPCGDRQNEAWGKVAPLLEFHHPQ